MLTYRLLGDKNPLANEEIWRKVKNVIYEDLISIDSLCFYSDSINREFSRECSA